MSVPIPPRNPAFFDPIAVNPGTGQTYTEHPIVGHPLLGGETPYGAMPAGVQLPALDPNFIQNIAPTVAYNQSPANLIPKPTIAPASGGPTNMGGVAELAALINPRTGGITSGLTPDQPFSQNSAYEQFKQHYANVAAQVAAGTYNPQTATTVGGNPFAQNPAAVGGNNINPFLSSGLPINEMMLGQLMATDPTMAITLGGAADFGSPGYYNLAGLNFDPATIFLLSGGTSMATPTEYFANAADTYRTLGTVGSEGGGVANVAELMGALLSAGTDTEVGQSIATDPSVFYNMGMDILVAGGVSPMGIKAFQLQMSTLMNEYYETALTTNSDQLLPFNAWVMQNHPEVASAWTG